MNTALRMHQIIAFTDSETSSPLLSESSLPTGSGMETGSEGSGAICQGLELIGPVPFKVHQHEDLNNDNYTQCILRRIIIMNKGHH